ncbi:SWIM zinc finger family protein [Streptomyces blattellae]|uniref:SWIM zinc finger family protein n=1 Tax=Streptomyces blattellae TaxID=2569855 RepID=UPI0012B97769|nr:SWIM zinc finger family protein [Streptomyces blattellae]
MTSRPADEARRALRAAREHARRRDGDPQGSQPGAEAGCGDEVTAPERVVATGRLAGGAARAEDDEAAGDDVRRTTADPSGGAPRPGDAARAALRHALTARRSAAAGPAVSASTADVPAGTAGGETSGEEQNRLGDETERAREEGRAGAAGARAPRSAPTGSDPSRPLHPVTSADAPLARPSARPADVSPVRSSDLSADVSLVRSSDLSADVSLVRSSAGFADVSPVRSSDPPAGTPLARSSPRFAGTPPLPPSDPPADPPPPPLSNPHTAPRDPGSPNVHTHRDTRVPARSPSRRSGGGSTRAGTGLAELRRTFPAFPPVLSSSGGFAVTWWGNAWVAALEEGALDAKRLARGRGYAQQGNVEAITVTPGLVLAYVQGSRPRPYRVQLRLRTLEDADWERFLDTAAERPGHIAALLDKELPQSLADCGVPLLPGPGELAPQCSCPDRGHPCKHAAALCYQTARLLDADPFVLLLLRGRGERELLDSLSRRNAARAARAAQQREPAPLPGVRATDALAPRQLPPLPAPLPTPPHPEQPPVYPAAPGGPDPFALDQLASDAAVRAHTLLATGRDPVAELTLWQDAVRLAAARPGSGLTAGTRSLYASLASAVGRTSAELARAVAAWRQGGLEGLAVLDEPWDPPAGRFDRARPLLLAADLPAFRPWRNRLTHPRGHVQLRLGRDGIWYPYESEPGHDDWWPRGTPDLDPVGALTGLGMSPED